MTAKEYLMQIRMMEAHIVTLDAELKRLRAELSDINDVSIRSAWPDGQPHGTGTSDPVGSTALKMINDVDKLRESLKGQLMDTEINMLHARSDLWTKKTEIIETVGKVRDTDCYQLLCKRYIESLTWEQIAVDMEYSYQWVCGGLHSRALNEIEKILKNRIS